MDEIPDVLCINCEDIIEYHKLNAHSCICFKPTNQVMKLIHSTNVQQLQYQVSKLKIRIEAVFYHSFSEISQVFKENLQFLMQKADEILSLNDENMETVNKLTAINSQIRKISAQTLGKYSVYSERLKLLSLEKTYNLIDFISQKKEKKTLSFRLLRTKRQETDFKNSKSYDNFNQNLRVGNEFIEEVVSQIDSKYTMRSSIASPADWEENQCEFFEIPEMEEKSIKIFEENKSTTNFDRKKFFFSKCLIAKSKFPSRDPAQFIQINDLYQFIMIKQIPSEQWDEFIKDQFLHPECWVNIKQISLNR